MAFREVSVVEVCEVLRGWLGGAGLRTVAGREWTARPHAAMWPPPRRPGCVARVASPS